MGVRLPLVEQYLGAQHDLRAASHFARLHEAGRVETTTGLYEAQIPLSAPGPGQQYAFSVDLDACTGCKACVIGCNKLNGLDPDEAWRSVGTLHGKGESKVVQHTVTTACHHCLDPGCMKGCPVGAYEKDPHTGIVRHLDDQCIGCQYCTLTCPYDVPQYSERLGIVRKCDMCTDRLTAGEAPACVQSCPNGAISIRLVEVAEVRERGQAGAVAPGAPPSRLTHPTTVYTSKDPLPAGIEPANAWSVRPAHAHAPLVLMLVLTQLSVGAFVAAALWSPLLVGTSAFALLVLLAAGTGFVGLNAALLHLGRPQYAFRAFIGLRTSWMSREIVVFGGYSQLALATAAVSALTWFPDLSSSLRTSLVPQSLTLWLTGGGAARALTVATAAVGLVSVACSAMIYVVTGRRFWSARLALPKFFGTTALLGAATAVTALTFAPLRGALQDQTLGASVLALTLATMLKLLHELSLARHLRASEPTDLWRSAALVWRDFGALLAFRLAVGLTGGVLLPLLLLVRAVPLDSTAARVLAVLLLACSVAGELLERLLFFVACAPARMPGGIGK